MSDEEGARASFAVYDAALFHLLEVILEVRDLWEIQRTIALVRIAGGYFHNIEFDEEATWEIMRRMLIVGEAAICELQKMMADAEELETGFYSWLYD